MDKSIAKTVEKDVGLPRAKKKEKKNRNKGDQRTETKVIKEQSEYFDTASPT